MEKIEPGKYVAISYDLFDLAQGKEELVHQVPADEPEVLVYGVSQYVIEPLQKAIEGLEKGQTFSVVMKPEEGFGEYREDMLRTEAVPRAIFETEGKLDEKKIYPGAQIFLQTNVGQDVSAVVLEVGATEVTVKVDFNHPLAGRTLRIAGKIEEVRPATDAEINDAMGHGACCGCGSEGCADGGCSGGCEGGCCGAN